ncbi:hypothetical protein, partial [Serratia marcescens]|uniref:hypothetical protein n=1 Tax=Serratia marcescens TaxID=615 RepID=UPI003F803857
GSCEDEVLEEELLDDEDASLDEVDEVDAPLGAVLLGEALPALAVDDAEDEDGVLPAEPVSPGEADAELDELGVDVVARSAAVSVGSEPSCAAAGSSTAGSIIHVTGAPGFEARRRWLSEPGPMALFHASKRSRPLAVNSFGSAGSVMGMTTEVD